MDVDYEGFMQTKQVARRCQGLLFAAHTAKLMVGAPSLDLLDLSAA